MHTSHLYFYLIFILFSYNSFIPTLIYIQKTPPFGEIVLQFYIFVYFFWGEMETMFSLFSMEFLLFSLIGLACAVEFFDKQKRLQQERLSSPPPSLQEIYTSPTIHREQQILQEEVEDDDDNNTDFDCQSQVDPTPDYYDTTSLTSVVGDIDLFYEPGQPGRIMKYEPPPPYSLYPHATRRKLAKNKIKGACRRLMRLG